MMSDTREENDGWVHPGCALFLPGLFALAVVLLATAKFFELPEVR